MLYRLFRLFVALVAVLFAVFGVIALYYSWDGDALHHYYPVNLRFAARHFLVSGIAALLAFNRRFPLLHKT